MPAFCEPAVSSTASGLILWKLNRTVFYTLMQMCVVVPILMPLHMLYAPDNINRTSMLRAGIDGLVASSGSKWLWVHAVLIWWISITWTSTTLWIGWGGLAYRRRGIARLQENVRTGRKERNSLSRGEEGPSDSDIWPVADDSEGIKKHRALMIINVPPDSEFFMSLALDSCCPLC